MIGYISARKMLNFCMGLRWLKRSLSYTLLILLVIGFWTNMVDSGGDLGSIECVNGKWQADTKIISLLVVCPVQLSWESYMCIFKRLGLYDNGSVNKDFHIFLCSLFWKRNIIDYCIDKFTYCLDYYGGVSGLQLTLFPVGVCIYEAIHKKVNCTM